MAGIAREYGGKITTIEYDEQSAQQAIKNFGMRALLNVSALIIGDAWEIIPTLNESMI